MTYDISNPSLHTYEEMEQFCQNKSGNLASVDSNSKLNVLKSLMKRFDNGKKDQRYLIGKQIIAKNTHIFSIKESSN